MGANTMTAIATGVQVGASITTAVLAKQQSNDARDLAIEKEGILAGLENSRQDVINPYANMSNQYANLGVATQAARFQAEEADQALANTLDTLRVTGASAGGATALAMAALKSKQGVSASIEAQEAANEKLKAQGAQQVEQMIAQGEGMKWQANEERQLQELDRTQAQIDNAKAQQYASNAAFMGSLGNIGSAAMSGAFNMNPKSTDTTVDPKNTNTNYGIGGQDVFEDEFNTLLKNYTNTQSGNDAIITG